MRRWKPPSRRVRQRPRPAATARERLSRADAARARLAAEAQALGEVLAVKDGERWPPMVDALAVPAGLEAALGAALGEELAAAADREAARHWRVLPTLPATPLPAGSRPLAAEVEAPGALARALGGIGLVEDEAAGEAGQAALAPGQTLVSRAGAIWRWDGYTVRAGTQTAAAVRLQQRNRLATLGAALREAEAETAAARDARQAADLADRDATAAEQRARAARRDAEQAAERARGHRFVAADAGRRMRRTGSRRWRKISPPCCRKRRRPTRRSPRRGRGRRRCLTSRRPARRWRLPARH